MLLPTVSQLQQTLVSLQELLIQQQQRIQELSQELAAAEVTTTSSSTQQTSLTITSNMKFTGISLVSVKPLFTVPNYLDFFHHLLLSLIYWIKLDLSIYSDCNLFNDEICTLVTCTLIFLCYYVFSGNQQLT